MFQFNKSQLRWCVRAGGAGGGGRLHGGLSGLPRHGHRATARIQQEDTQVRPRIVTPIDDLDMFVI